MIGAPLVVYPPYTFRHLPGALRDDVIAAAGGQQRPARGALIRACSLDDRCAGGRRSAIDAHAEVAVRRRDVGGRDDGQIQIELIVERARALARILDQRRAARVRCAAHVHAHAARRGHDPVARADRDDRPLVIGLAVALTCVLDQLRAAVQRAPGHVQAQAAALQHDVIAVADGNERPCRVAQARARGLHDARARCARVAGRRDAQPAVRADDVRVGRRDGRRRALRQQYARNQQAKPISAVPPRESKEMHIRLIVCFPAPY